MLFRGLGGTFEDFTDRYINKRNPATGMYWLIADAAVDFGISVPEAEALVTRSQIANAVAVGVIPPADVTEQPDTFYAPGYFEGLEDAGVTVHYAAVVPVQAPVEPALNGDVYAGIQYPSGLPITPDLPIVPAVVEAAESPFSQIPIWVWLAAGAILLTR